MLGRENRTESAAAFVAMTGDRKLGTMTEKAECKHGEKIGYDKSSCYELVAYPPG